MANPNPSPATRFRAGEVANPGGRPKSRPYSEAARELLAADGDIPTMWKAEALTNAQKAVLADYKAWIEERDGAARQQMLDRVEGKPGMADEDRDALGKGDGLTLRALIGRIDRE